MRRMGESGNALWFILIAIVLVGLLTIVLSRSSTSVDQGGDFEQMRVQASQILRTVKSYEAAIQQMRGRGVSEGDISFENGPSGYTNANCSIEDCRVFGLGGGLTYTAPPAAAGGGDWIFTGANNVGDTTGYTGTTAAGTGNDLLMMLENPGQSLCSQLNRMLDIDGIPVDSSGLGRDGVTGDLLAFSGAYQSDTLHVIDGDGGELNGKNAGCFTDTAPDPDVLYFYAVILPR